MDKLPLVQAKNVSTMMRRIKILSSLYEEIQETNRPLRPSSILCLTELFSVNRRVKLLIQACKEGSTLWNLVQTEIISNQFHVIVKEMGGALDILPLSLLDLTADTKEQIELLHKQAKRVQLFVDTREIQRKEELLQVMAANNEKNSKNKGFIDLRKLREILNSIGLRNSFDYDQEISKLGAEAEKQAGTGGLIVVSNINNLAGITDEALAVLSLLLGCSEGLEEIRKSTVLVPLLIDLLRFGSPKGKENSITLLLGLCKDGGDDVARRLLINPRSIPSLRSLATDGSLKARRKADALLRLLSRCCSQSQNPVG
ncbi:U-box domain-containing protein 1 [Camellia lanceoleosa]|uniref:U-box domain-containing protein 1 n=1 Tax=Camellia lanceoleosa TaxID=1840588 RepID=A0ACC0H7H1_9ERIC|nr:U-box domain-containing protein 1 [Camellia lanceoleosa]